MAFNLRTKRSLGNTLIRRVQRHSNMATLFRSPQEPFPSAAASPALAWRGDLGGFGQAGTSSSDIPMVSASLIPASNSYETAGQVEETVQMPAVVQPDQPRRPVLRQESETSIPPAARQMPTPRASVVPPALQRASEATERKTPADRVQPKVELPPAQPEPTSPEDESRIWSRLQNIFRRHQEKQEEEGMSETEPGQPSETPDSGGRPASVQTSRENRPSADASSSQTAVDRPQQRQAARAIIQEEPLPRQAARPGQVERTAPEQPAPKKAALEEAAPEQAVPEQAAPEQAEPKRAEPEQPVLDQGQQLQTSVQAVRPAGLDVPKPTLPGVDDVEASDRAVDQVETRPVGEVAEVQQMASPEEEIQAQEPDTAQAETDLGETQISPALPTMKREMVSSAETLPETAGGQIQTEMAQEPSAGDAAQPTVRTSQGEATVRPAVLQTAKAADQASPGEAPSQPADVYAVDEDGEVESAQEYQATSLEDAWPVQRLAEAEKPEPEAAQPAPSAELAHTPEARQVSSLLQNVTPGQPTDSSVEVVTPRRPRPVQQTSAPVQASIQEQPAAQVQPDAAGVLTAVDPELERPTPPEIGAGPVQTRPENAVDSVQSPTLIPTEIGALPSDLWRLIGQEPPQAAAESPPAAVQRQADREGRTAPEMTADSPLRPPELPTRSPAKPIETAEAAPQLMTYQAPAVVQRADISDLQSEVEREDDAGDGSPAAEVNVDELSRRVYQEVKRRLTQEWERMRRRL